MADSLGGIVTGGLLGAGVSSLILAKFNLFGFGVEVIEPPVEPPITGGGGGGGYGPGPVSHDKLLRIWINIRGKQYSKSYLVSDRVATPLIKAVNVTEKVVVSIKKIGKKND